MLYRCIHILPEETIWYGAHCSVSIVYQTRRVLVGKTKIIQRIATCQLKRCIDAKIDTLVRINVANRNRDEVQ